MAVLYRTTQTADYVCVHDQSVVVPDPAPDPWPAPDPDWLPADGQPAAATRFTVRPLSPAEYEAAMSKLQAGAAQFELACCAGLVAVDGQPTDPALLASGWPRAVANLVAAISTVPMLGLVSRSKIRPSSDSTAGD